MVKRIWYNIHKCENSKPVLNKVEYEQSDDFKDPWECVTPAIESATMIIIIAPSTSADSEYNRQELRYVVGDTDHTMEKKLFIMVECEPTFQFSISRIKTFLKDYETVPYKRSIEVLASTVADRLLISKNKR
ncbi:unnamed protein product [Adineta ricciae]|uniref:TIR domain-containing protein n=1 Tax=Adineta ricciae TaxID=249248 RepID=A0A816CS17_ADIRI|nr:unnamed protein product [Adineta ricciae]CAF1628898.1 unnamed protein product [Adineta ricciae]